MFFIGPNALERLVGRLYAEAYERDPAVCEGQADDYDFADVVHNFKHGGVMTAYNSVAVHDLSHVEVVDGRASFQPTPSRWIDFKFISKDGDVLVVGIFYDNVAENQIRLSKLADFMRDNFAEPRPVTIEQTEEGYDLECHRKHGLGALNR